LGSIFFTTRVISGFCIGVRSSLFWNVIRCRLIGCSETSVNNSQSTLCHITKERRSYCNKSWKNTFLVRNLKLRSEHTQQLYHSAQLQFTHTQRVYTRWAKSRYTVIIFFTSIVNDGRILKYRTKKVDFEAILGK
jgi:hypothetical protein